ncbi:hypothetical protein LV89_00957 [Arcicella aurantiaca]|uniref:Uncharacterized protein n=1 Tax=Arcicella aurantiaca TaxID=591202 RepID=A0A316EFJ4_9BACT|nr:hypothetical protein [Arcicella aurantiaca]PWK28179.1 hypothetical protein LV89_00957 [Arcicella aurantiaca]
MEQISKLPLDTDSILVHFNLPRLREGKLIDEWVTAKGVLNSGESERIEKLYRKALKSGDGWNEEELKMKFISLLFDLADIEEEDKIISFYERPMNATFNGTKIGVICDCLLASPAGISTPKTPYFFLQEFKKQKGDSNDPEAQMLAAMLVAQYKNADNKPIYGAWLVGSIWNFTLLQGSEYFVSHKFDASNLEDLTQIVFILRRLKELIKSR